MKKGLLSLFIFSIVIVHLTSCDNLEWGPWRKFVTIQNNSDKTLLIGMGQDYPNTSKITYSKEDKCPPYQSIDYITAYYRDELFRENPVVELFIFDCDDLDAYYANDKVPLQVLIEQLPKADILLKRYELTREWLEQHDWTVTYP